MKNAEIRREYEIFCAKNHDLPVFFEPFWLDAVCGNSKNWSAILLKNGDEIVGIWPYFFKKKWGIEYVAVPPLTRFSGVFFSENYKVRSNEFLKKCLKNLPNWVVFEQDFHYQMQNWLPFSQAGFRQLSRYSYKILMNSGLDSILENIENDYRNNKIAKAKKILTLKIGGSLDAFWKIHELGFLKKGNKLSFDFHFLKNLDAVLEKNGRRNLFFAIDSLGNIHAVGYLIWDKTSAYLLMQGENPEFRSSGGGVFLIWEMIQYAHDVLKVREFDFLGSMIEPVAKVRRQFGATPFPYYRIQKEKNIFWKILKFAGR